MQVRTALKNGFQRRGLFTGALSGIAISLLFVNCALIRSAPETEEEMVVMREGDLNLVHWPRKAVVFKDPMGDGLKVTWEEVSYPVNRRSGPLSLTATTKASWTDDAVLFIDEQGSRTERMSYAALLQALAKGSGIKKAVDASVVAGKRSCR